MTIYQRLEVAEHNAKYQLGVIADLGAIIRRQDTELRDAKDRADRSERAFYELWEAHVALGDALKETLGALQKMTDENAEKETLLLALGHTFAPEKEGVQQVHETNSYETDEPFTDPDFTRPREEDRRDTEPPRPQEEWEKWRPFTPGD
jgi:hypothetical protein